MLINLFVGTLVISLTVIVHTLGLVVVANIMNAIAERRPIHGYRRKVAAMIAVMYALFAIHTVEIWIWAAVYFHLDAITLFEDALYFSAITFSTLGYGDSLIEDQWQLLAGLEGISGFLLIGWSTAYLVSASTRLGPFQAGKHF